MVFDPIEYINTPRWQQQRLGLERIQALMEKLDHPQDRLKFLHVAGTNGKGSVCAYTAQILQEAGYRTGLFTSPYIERFEERIRVDGANISADDLREVTLAVRDAADELEREMGEHPTEFELMTAVALLHFARQQCDIAVVEVGLGGRLDSTNVILPEVSVITRIGLDHTDILGDTLEKIAAEKAGIIKPGVPVAAYPQEAEVMAVIENTCEDRGSKMHAPDFASVKVGGVGSDGLRRFEYDGISYTTQLLATYQPYNAALAITVANILVQQGWGITQQDIERGISLTKWPGRFEMVCCDPLFIVDGAHNPQGAKALRASLEDMADNVALSDDSFAHKEIDVVFLVGVLSDKDHAGMLDALMHGESDSEPLFSKAVFITYTPDNPRALDSRSLAAEISSYAENDLAKEPIEVRACETPEEAAELAIEVASSVYDSGRRIAIAFGTLYAIGQIKETLRHFRKAS